MRSIAHASFPHVMDAPRRPQPGRATALAGLLAGAGVVGLAFSDLGQLFTPLAALLTAFALAAELGAARYSASLVVSAAFAADMLAIGFLGPAPAFVIPAVVYIAIWVVERYRWRAMLINLAGSATPAPARGSRWRACPPRTRPKRPATPSSARRRARPRGRTPSAVPRAA